MKDEGEKDSQTEFYGELDKAWLKNKHFRPPAVLVIFILALVATELVIFLFAYGIKSPSSSSGATGVSEVPLKFSSVGLDANRIQISLPEGILCSKLQSVEGFDNLHCLISPDGVELTGSFGIFFPSNSKAVLMPRASENKLVWEVREFKVGKITFASKYANKMSGNLNGLLSSDIPEFSSARVESVEVGEGYVLITAIRP